MNLCQQIGHHMQELTRIEGELDALRRRATKAGAENIGEVQKGLQQKEAAFEEQQQHIWDLQYNVPQIFASRLSARMGTPVSHHDLKIKADAQGYLSELYLEGSKIDALPIDLQKLTCLKKLTINALRRLDPTSGPFPEEWYTHPSLESLDIRGESVEHFGIDIARLGSIPNLKELSVIDKVLEHQREKLWQLQNLTTLTIDGEMNNQEGINLEGIETLPSLKSVHIKGGGIVAHGECLWKAPSLKKVELSQVREISLKGLEKTSLQECIFDKVHSFEEGQDLSGLWQIASLEKVVLHNQPNIGSLQNIGNCSYLFEFCLDYSDLEEKVWQLPPSVRRLEISDEGLKNLKDWESLPLTNLSISGGKNKPNLKEGETLLGQIKKIGTLEHLTLTQIEDLEAIGNSDLSTFQNLSSISLRDLRLKSIEAILQNAPNLKKLDVMSLRELSGSLTLSSEHLPQLQKLRINDSPLQDLTLRGLDQLTNLAVSTPLTTLPTGIRGCTALQTLNLAHTSIESLDPGDLGPLKALRRIDLSHTPLAASGGKESIMPHVPRHCDIRAAHN